MKVRDGFVSNSSSSSFIIGCAEVKDVEALKKWMATNKISSDVAEIKSTEMLRENKTWKYTCVMHVDGNRLHVDAAVNSGRAIGMEIEDGKNYFVVYVGNDEGDTAFWDEEVCELVWERANDPKYFCREQKAVLDLLIKEKSVERMLNGVHYAFGAERNG